MYTRSYYTEDDKINVPENYNGTALKEPIENQTIEEKTDAEPLRAPWDIQKSEALASSEAVITDKKSESGFIGTLLKKLPLPPGVLSAGIFKSGLEKIGFEEMLIIGVALLMLFGKGGDKECAVMLFLLLFVK